MRFRKPQSPRQSSWCAVFVRQGRYALVRCEQPAGALPRVTTFATGEAVGDIAPALAQAVGKARLRGQPVSALLPRGAYSVHLVDAPAVPAEEWRAAVRWSLKDSLGYPPEEAVVDVIPVPHVGAAAGRAQQVLGVASPKSEVAAVIDWCDRAGLELRAVDIPEMAQRNVAALFEEGERALALVTLTSTRALLTITARGELYLARTLDIGTDVLAQSPAEAVAALIDRIVLDLQRTLDHFDRQYGGLQVSGLLIAPFPQAGALRLALAESLSVGVDVADLGTVMDLGAIPALADPVVQGRHLRTLGAALRCG